MLYVFTGRDSIAVRARAHEFLDAYEEKGIRVERMSPEECTPEALRDRATAQSLFLPEGLCEVVFLDTPGKLAEAREAVVSVLAELADSPNIFVLLESALPVPAAAACTPTPFAPTRLLFDQPRP